MQVSDEVQQESECLCAFASRRGRARQDTLKAVNRTYDAAPARAVPDRIVIVCPEWDIDEVKGRSVPPLKADAVRPKGCVCNGLPRQKIADGLSGVACEPGFGNLGDQSVAEVEPHRVGLQPCGEPSGREQEP